MSQSLADNERTDARAMHTDWTRLDEVYSAHLQLKLDPGARWLLEQSLLTANERRSMVASIRVRPGSQVLDLGTGFGPIALELAHLHPINVIGVDNDPDLLDHTREIAGELTDWLGTESSVRFHQEEVTGLSFGNEQFDLVTARLLFQHLKRPQAAIAEVARVLRHGGSVWILDVDDGMSLTYPPASVAEVMLERAFATLQAERGGDREIGRKLPGYLAEQGLYVQDVRLVSQAQFASSRPGDLARSATAARIRAVRDELLANKGIDASEFDSALEALENEPLKTMLRVESQMIVVAQKP
jgi:SAM-dependent methyltransferase